MQLYNLSRKKTNWFNNAETHRLLLCDVFLQIPPNIPDERDLRSWTDVTISFSYELLYHNVFPRYRNMLRGMQSNEPSHPYTSWHMKPETHTRYKLWSLHETSPSENRAKRKGACLEKLRYDSLRSWASERPWVPFSSFVEETVRLVRLIGFSKQALSVQ